tara:strand:+ start:346 stop:3678 length:3333 start_codon:yes stop_codon:yes gene_type:complete
MPKQTHIYRDFSGGENTSTSPRLIKQNELQLVSGAMVDEMGYLSSFYPPQRSTKSEFYNDFTYTVEPGRGLFYFKSDYSYSSTADTASSGPYHYLLVFDRATGNFSLSDGVTKTEVGDTNIKVPDFYFHNNVLRIGNAGADKYDNSVAAEGQYWFGPIGDTSGKSLLGHTYTKRWYLGKNDLTAPFFGLVGRCHGDTHTMDDVQSINAVAKTDLAGTSTVQNNSGVVQFNATGHGMLDGDTVIISGSEYYSGSHTVANKGTNTFEISKTWLSVSEDETPEWRRKGEPAWFSGWQGTSGASIGVSDPSIAAAEAHNYNYAVWNDASTDELREITAAADNDLTITSGTSTTGVFQVYPPIGDVTIPMGMNLDFYQSYGSDKGAWPPGEYEFGQSLVYEGNQESLITKLFGDNITIDANEVVYARVLISGLNETSAAPGTGVNVNIDPRLIGGRVYTRKAGTGDNWILLLDADFRVTAAGVGGGTRTNLTDTFDSWNVRTAGANTSNMWEAVGQGHGIGDDASKWRGFYSNQYTINSPSPFTYEAINGFSQDEVSLAFNDVPQTNGTTFMYKTSVLCNSRVFVANLKYFDNRSQNSSVTKMGDAILYSPPNKMDTFPASNRLDIAEGDGDEFTCLMESGGMLLAFKESTLYIVDVKNPNPAGWRLQGKFDGLGIKNPHSATKIQSAVAFANNYGCWIYDNGQIKDLIQGKISSTQWQNWTRDTYKKGQFTSTASATTSERLIDSSAKFVLSDISEGDKIVNTTDSTFTFVKVRNSATEITTADASGSLETIMALGESYYIESKTFGPNVGYDNVSKKLIIVNDCQNISDSPRFYDLITGAWTRGWDNAPDRTGAALKTGVSYFMDGKLHQDAVSSAGIEWDTMNNSWTNFVTIPEATGLDSIGHNSAGTGAAVYVDGSMTESNQRNIYMFAMKQKVTDYSITEAGASNGDAGANRTRYNIVTRDEDFGAPNNIKKIYGISIDYITETGDENFAFDIRYQINGGLVTSDIGREWLVLDSTNFISANDDGVGTAQGNSINTYEIRYPEFSVNAFQSPLKCYSIALQINNKNEEAASSKRQYFKIVSISIKYRIVGKTSQTDTSAFDTDTMVQSSS